MCRSCTVYVLLFFVFMFFATLYFIIHSGYAKLFDDIKDSWNKLGGNDSINTFEKKWCEWDVDDTIEWFKFVLNMKNGGDDDYEIDDYSTSDSSDSSDDDDDDENDHELLDDEKKQELNEIDFQDIKSHLLSIHFKSKGFPMLSKTFQFKRFGFKNKKDCKLLCKKTQELIEKYPKKGKKSKKHSKRQDNHGSTRNNSNMEGFVEDTNIV